MVMDGHGIDVDFVLTHHLAIANVNKVKKGSDLPILVARSIITSKAMFG